MSVHEVLSIIEDEADEIDQASVYIEPPGDGHNSDEDSGDEEMAEGSFNALPPSQLGNPGSAIILNHGGASTSIRTATEEDDEESEVKKKILLLLLPLGRQRQA